MKLILITLLLACSMLSYGQEENGPVTPVELTSFTVHLEKGQPVLNWVTASEHINDHFTLFYSDNGKSFVEVAQVKGHGSSTVSNYYMYQDRQPVEGQIYYKLFQTDDDGTVKELDTVAIYINSYKTAGNVYSVLYYDLYGRLTEKGQGEVQIMRVVTDQGTSSSLVK